MRIACLLLVVTVAGCASSAGPMVPTAPPVLQPAPTFEAQADVIEVEVESIPLPPLGADPEQIVVRRLFPDARVAEWTLANELTVVYARDEGADGYTAHLSANRGWRTLRVPDRTPLTATWGQMSATLGPDLRLATGRSERLQSLLADLVRVFTDAADDTALAPVFDRPGQFTLVLHGPMEREWAEGAVGRALSGIRGRRPILVDDAPRDTLRASEPGRQRTVSVSVDLDDLAAATLLADLVAERSAGSAALRIEPGGRLTLVADAGTPLRDVLSPVAEGSFREARARAARRAETPEGIVRALVDLYALPGRYRPVRPPVVARDLPGRIERTPPSRVDALRQRLLAAPPTLLVTDG